MKNTKHATQLGNGIKSESMKRVAQEVMGRIASGWSAKRAVREAVDMALGMTSASMLARMRKKSISDGVELGTFTKRNAIAPFERGTEGMERLARYHNRPLTNEQLDDLIAQQDGIMLRAVTTVEGLLSGGRVGAKYEAVFDDFLTYALQVFRSDLFNHPKRFRALQDRFIRRLYKHDLNPDTALSLEFLLGLVRFVVLSKFALEALRFAVDSGIVNPQKDLVSNVADLEGDLAQIFLLEAGGASGDPDLTRSDWHPATKRLKFLDALKRASCVIHRSHLPNLENIWEFVRDFFNPKEGEVDGASRSRMKELSQYIYSIQYVNEYALDKMGLAQCFHWRGTGGRGGVFASHPQLKNLLNSHCIGFHQDWGGSATRQMTMEAIIANRRSSEKLVPFMEVLKGYRHENAAAVTDALLKSFGDQVDLEVFTLGSGYNLSAESGTLSDLIKLGKRVSVIATEVDIQANAELRKLDVQDTNSLGSWRVSEVRMYDMNLPGRVHVEDYGRFHWISAGLCMHQVPHGQNGSPDIYHRILRDISYMLKPNGIFANPDVGIGVSNQAILIPGNATDREGYVPHVDEINYPTTAIKIADKETAGHDWFKMLYPLRDVEVAVPRELVDMGEAIYKSSIFRVIVLTSSELQEIKSFWKQGDYSKCDEMADGIMDRWNQGEREVQARTKVGAVALEIEKPVLKLEGWASRELGRESGAGHAVRGG